MARAGPAPPKGRRSARPRSPAFYPVEARAAALAFRAHSCEMDETRSADGSRRRSLLHQLVEPLAAKQQPAPSLRTQRPRNTLRSSNTLRPRIALRADNGIPLASRSWYAIVASHSRA